PFDVGSLQLKDVLIPIAGDASSGLLGVPPEFSASNNGVLAYQITRNGSSGRLVWFDERGGELGRISQLEAEELLNAAISPDGTHVAVNRMDPATGKWDIWVLDVQRDVRSRFTSSPGRNSDPVWSVDGAFIAFASNRTGRWGIYRKRANGIDQEELVA